MEKMKLRAIIINYLIRITVVMMVVIFFSFAYIQMRNVTRQTRRNAGNIFTQIEQILDTNEVDLEELEEEYSDSCLNKAETIAYILQYHPSILGEEDLVELVKVAGFVQVDEIHVFNQQGEIIFGTHPEYYGFTFDSGEQMQFFKPMLEDYNLKLVQEITPNTAEGKMVQYSAVWSKNQQFIVQVGMYPETVLHAMEKNELPYIFSLLRANSGVTLMAIDQQTGEILGCTDSRMVGKNKTEMGFPEEVEVLSENGEILTINREKQFVAYTSINDTYIAYVEPISLIYRGTFRSYVYFAIGLLLISFAVVATVSYYVNRFVIDNIYIVNGMLRRITDGDLDVKVDIHENKEFSELSEHINDMVDSLVSTNKKLSNALVQIEEERDRDSLTNLLNRRGLDNAMQRLEERPLELKHCALIMADADGLKEINDKLGREAGDRYLLAVADIIKKFDTDGAVAARQGGDEFVLFLWGFDSKEALMNKLEILQTYQSGLYTEVAELESREIRFSLGYALDENHLDYQELLKQADSNMYENKTLRKSAR